MWPHYFTLNLHSLIPPFARVTEHTRVTWELKWWWYRGNFCGRRHHLCLCSKQVHKCLFTITRSYPCLHGFQFFFRLITKPKKSPRPNSPRSHLANQNGGSLLRASLPSSPNQIMSSSFLQPCFLLHFARLFRSVMPQRTATSNSYCSRTCRLFHRRQMHWLCGGCPVCCHWGGKMFAALRWVLRVTRKDVLGKCRESPAMTGSF